MRSLLILLILFFTGQATMAQHMVFGKAISRSTGEAIAFARVQANNENFTYSNISGEFQLEISPETRLLEITRQIGRAHV